MKMSYESSIGNLSTYLMNMSALGSYNNMAPMGYLPFSNVLSSVLGTLSLSNLNTQNITGLRTISADSALQKELNKLGCGNMMILIPEEYQKQVEENAENSQKSEKPLKSGRLITTPQMLEKARLRAVLEVRAPLSLVRHTTTLWEVAILACGYKKYG